MKKNLLFSAVIFLSFFTSAQAKETSQYPNISGNVLTQFQTDRIVSGNQKGIPSTNAFLYVESNVSLNIDSNWSVKTDWRMQPNDTLTTRDPVYPERYRTILSRNRGLNISDEGLIIEELKLQFQNEDLKFVAGKFDPTFGTVFNKSKRMGIFTAQFAEDYNLREKIGAGITALLEDSKITFNSFFNDTTGLSSSALNNRGRASRNDGVAGNTGTLSSYSISADGSNLFGYENWFYNVGYRSLDADKTRETGFVVGSEYLYKLSSLTSIIPLAEVVRINNFTGASGRTATYTTLSLIGKYSSWTASITHLTRNITMSQAIPKSTDKQLQLSVGYKFTNNITLDVTRATIKENGKSAGLMGLMASYIYQF